MCGASSERTDEIWARINLESPAFAPECVFIHIGTNDVTQLASGGGPNSTAQSMEFVTSILDKFRAANSTCKVFICKIIDNQTYSSQVNTYNASLTTLVQARTDYVAGDLVLVDMNAAMGAYSATNYGDATHPNAKGYGKMGLAFYNAFITKF
jgi:lysophospholipase L1-like esterase